MISNSHSNSQKTAFGSELPPSTRAADAYSDDLMDDLFSDVDQILEGDLSSYMTVVNHNAKPINPSTRTVQLPDNFVPQSAADIYRATVAASRQPEYRPVAQPSQPASRQAQPIPHTSSAINLSRQPINNRSMSYGGGRPVTAARPTAARSGNLQTAVIQTPVQSPNAQLYSAPANTRWPVAPQDEPSPIQSISNYLYPEQSYTELTLANASARPPQTIFEPRAKPQSQPVSLPFLLIGAASISAVSSLGLWTLSQNAPNNGWLLSLNREAAAAELPDNSTEDFLAYLQQSIDVISAREAQANQTVAVLPVVNSAPTVPTTVPNTNPAAPVGVLPNLPGAKAAANVIERVFVPVYQNQNSAQAAAPAPVAPPLPAVALPSQAQKPTVPVPAPVAAAAAIPPGAPSNATPSIPIVPVGAGSLPTPAPSTTIAVAPTNAAAAITNVTPNSEHALVGILNLGSRSAALFNVDGNSQRAYVGDRIGVSDWTLVSVNGQDVQVRRDGEVRSVYIGQRF